MGQETPLKDRPGENAPQGYPSSEVKTYLGRILYLEDEGPVVNVQDRTGTLKWDHIRIGGACHIQSNGTPRLVIDLAVHTPKTKNPVIFRLEGETLHFTQGLESENLEEAFAKFFKLLKSHAQCDILPTAKAWERPKVPIFRNEAFFHEAYRLALNNLNGNNGNNRDNGSKA